jgi:hypothetical protein
MSCLDIEEAVELSRPPFEALYRVGERFRGDRDSPEACYAFSQQVNKCTEAVQYCYRLVACAARAADLETTAAGWSAMATLCKGMLRKLQTLKEEFPDCGTPELHDLVLEYLTASNDRLELTKEMQRCQTLEMPAGLFPEMT